MHKQRLSLVISAAVGIIATFLPFMKTWFNSVSLIETRDGSGYVVLALFAICIIITLVGNRTAAMTKGHLAGAIIAGVLPGLLIILAAIAMGNDDLANIFTSFDIGFYVILVVSAAIVILGLSIKDSETAPSNREVINSVFCTSCGKELTGETSDEFCDNCGSKL
jgi:hypothetical protein